VFVLAVAALLILRPWDSGSDSTPLQLPDPPQLETGLGDGIAVAPGGGGPAIADARVAPGGIAVPVVDPDAVPDPVSISQLAVSPARPVAVSRQVSVPAPAPGPSPAAPVVPVAAPVEAPSTPAPSPSPSPPGAPPGPHLVADFENGLEGWSTAATSEVTPRLVGGIVRDGERSSLVRLTGTRSRSQLVLGGDGGEVDEGTVQIHEGDELAFAFSFYIQAMTYGEPGVDNAILRLKSDASESPAFDLQLWDSALGERGLWSSGDAVGGDSFLAPVGERVWHDAIVHFRASSLGTGFYAVYLDGELVDARDTVSLIAPGSSHAQIEVGLHRDGAQVPGTSEIRIDAARLGPTLESVQALPE